MLKNYLKVAFRSIVRSKLTSFINIFGLAFAMACSLLIYLYIQDELKYDRFNKNADHIYRVTRNFLSQDGSVSLHLGHVAPPFGPLLKNDFPDMTKVARTLQFNLLLAVEENGERTKTSMSRTPSSPSRRYSTSSPLKYSTAIRKHHCRDLLQSCCQTKWLTSISTRNRYKANICEPTINLTLK
ncbi:MAG: ABC transporter permease [Bacteroidia bacterium]|nr:ABC transporter permease [Bacteroidia bacterium]